MTTIGSLFSGYGGLDLGVQMALGPMRTAWVSDIEAGPQKILAQRFPHAPNLGDITTIDWQTVEPVDVITGGSPCQDLSTAGQRAGMKPGTRSGLWESMAHAIDTIRPPLVVWENVAGARSADAYSTCLLEPGPGRVGNQPARPVLRALGRVLGDLAALGYDARWHSVRAADVGAPHNRERVFVIAYPHESGGTQWGQPLAEAPQVPAPVIGDHLLPTPTSSDHTGTGHATQGGLNLRTAISLLPTPQARDRKGIPGDGFNLSSLPRTIALLPTPDVLGDNRKSPKFGNGRENFYDIIRDNRWGDYAEAVHQWEPIVDWPAPDPTDDKGRLSPIFVEWMMGLSEGWVTHTDTTRAQQLRALGNGVVPQQAAHAVTQMLTWQPIEVAA